MNPMSDTFSTLGGRPPVVRLVYRVPGFLLFILFLLRIGIGWHFSYEGYTKVRGPGAFTAAGYLKAARGPFKDYFVSLAGPWEKFVAQFTGSAHAEPATTSAPASSPAPPASQPAAVENPPQLVAINLIMSWGMLLLGLLFMLGWWTRTSGLLLMLMLAMFYLSAPPWTAEKLAFEEGNYLFINKNLIEFLATAAVAFSGVSRTWGLDAFSRIRREPRPTRGSAKPAETT
ncbi:MAG: hypothetical protein CHACPFDD_00638 [Phycisphaerae bacterium]|nr:hypothetical protein [Phycisphaerae bacterium]